MSRLPTEFYHGTSLEAAMKIQQEGFRVDLSGTNAGAMLGPGLYVTTTLQKALNYAQPNPAAGAIFKLRVDLGRCYKVTTGDPHMTTWGTQLGYDSAWSADGVNGQREENCILDPARRVEITDVIFGNTGQAKSKGYYVHQGRLHQRGAQPQGGRGLGATPPGQGRRRHQQPCRFFARGYCKYGDKCKFAHSGGGGGGGGGSSSVGGSVGGSTVVHGGAARKGSNPDGYESSSWYIGYRGGGSAWSGHKDLSAKLKPTTGDNPDVKMVAFGAHNSWVIITKAGGFVSSLNSMYSSLGDELAKKKGTALESASLGPNGRWYASWATTSIWNGPAELGTAIKAGAVKKVAFGSGPTTSSDCWFVLYTNGKVRPDTFSTSGRNTVLSVLADAPPRRCCFAVRI